MACAQLALVLATTTTAAAVAGAAITAAGTVSCGGALRLRGGGIEDGPVVKATAEHFKKCFGAEPEMTCIAPGRVNLIGEHTDYNDGFVLPCAIDYHIAACISPAEGSELQVAAVDFPADIAKIDLSAASIDKDADIKWSNYVRGVCRELQEKRGYKLKGAKLALGGNVPQGGGLSSSAALEMSVATALNHLCELGIGAKDLALVSQKAEHWVGCNCGIMDQLISSLGKPAHALLIDCRDLTTKEVKIPEGSSVVIVNSNKKHQLAGLDSEYNQRRAQCEEAARHFGVTALRDVTSQELLQRASELDPDTLRRARHVVTENERTVEAAAALEKGDLATMGKLMAQSHVSMRDDFEISTPEIDALVEIIDAVLKGRGGVRLTGAGFGGSVVCLTPDALVPDIKQAVEDLYPSRSGGIEATFHVCQASGGARKL